MSTETKKDTAVDANRREPGYYDLMSFIVSNAVAGEIMAVENYSELVPLMPEVESKVETVQQAREETKHVLLLQHLGKQLGFPVADRIVEPQWLAIRKHFSTAARKENLAACLIIQDLMTESMAIMLYRLLGEKGHHDAEIVSVAGNILRDELEHLDIGIDRIGKLNKQDPENVHDSLVWAHHRVAPELFSMVSTSCHSLCDTLELDCGSLSLEHIKTDIESLRLRAIDQYLEMLDSAGFDPKVTSPLIASMNAFAGLDRVEVGSKTDSGDCCSPSQGCC